MANTNDDIMILALEETFSVGEDAFFDSVAKTSSFAVVFEDDLTTGYFYDVDTAQDQKILDALHIYNVADVIDKNEPCKIQISWTDDYKIASLLINNYCHAIFDFKTKAGYCRNGFPECNSDWCEVNERKLTDELTENIFKKHR